MELLIYFNKKWQKNINVAMEINTIKTLKLGEMKSFQGDKREPVRRLVVRGALYQYVIISYFPMSNMVFDLRTCFFVYFIHIWVV